MSGRAVLPWVVAGVALAALGVTLGRSSHGRAVQHPEPRPGITAANVLPAAMVPAPGAREAYEAARGAPQILDGLYCHCNCSKHSGHRSLLTCFESEHGAYCDICMGEAMLASQLAASGSSLAAIRNAIDARFGT
ncbi:MAG TPA: CYCXC family (seleno)protein [Gemmatimonadales bacterium]|nr:CYCXC family (seleno)protein [Gemmatimonadales bacterium]